MRKISIILVGIIFISVMGLAGCTKKAANSQEAIQQAQSLKTVQEKVNYLVSQANAFINSKEFDQAINTAQYILSNLDANSQEAKSLLDKAKAELQKQAEAAAKNVKKKLGL